MRNILLSRAEAAQRLGISLATFDRIYKKCGLPYIVIGRSVKVPEQELDAWIAKNTKSTTDRK
jgi:excisionase family DNA binding protein